MTKMDERWLEAVLARVMLPPAPESLRERVLQQAREAAPCGVRILRQAFFRAFEAAAALLMIAGAAGRAY